LGSKGVVIELPSGLYEVVVDFVKQTGCILCPGIASTERVKHPNGHPQDHSYCTTSEYKTYFDRSAASALSMVWTTTSNRDLISSGNYLDWVVEIPTDRIQRYAAYFKKVIDTYFSKGAATWDKSDLLMILYTLGAIDFATGKIFESSVQGKAPELKVRENRLFTPRVPLNIVFRGPRNSYSESISYNWDVENEEWDKVFEWLKSIPDNLIFAKEEKNTSIVYDIKGTQDVAEDVNRLKENCAKHCFEKVYS
jgi:hypothetical protein